MTDVVLHKDCYSEILSWCDYYSLYVCSLVCLKWYNLAMDPIVYYRSWEVTQDMIKYPSEENQSYVLGKLMKHPVVKLMINPSTMKTKKAEIEENLVNNFRTNSGKFIQKNNVNELQNLLKSLSHVKSSFIQDALIEVMKETLFQNTDLNTECFSLFLKYANSMNCLCGGQWSSKWKPKTSETEELPWNTLDLHWNVFDDNIIQWLKRNNKLNYVLLILEKLSQMGSLPRIELVKAALQNNNKEWNLAIFNSFPEQYFWDIEVKLCQYAIEEDNAFILESIVGHEIFDPPFTSWDELITQALSHCKVNSLKILMKHEWFKDCSIPQDDFLLRLCRIGNTELIQIYTEIYPNTYFDSKYLIEACWHGKDSLVKFFLNRPEIYPGTKNNKPIRVACEFGHLEVVKTLISFGGQHVNITVNENYCFLISCEKNYSKLVEFLLTVPNVDPSALNNHAIRVASELGHNVIVKLLLKDDRVDPTAMDYYALRYAFKNGHSSCYLLLKEDPRTDDSVLIRSSDFWQLDNTRRTVLNNTDESSTPEPMMIRGCTSNSGHEWHTCRTNHRHPNHVIFPVNCHYCKQTLPFTANSCNNCGLVLCMKCNGE